MTIFRVTGPDGKVFDVTTPEGKTSADAIAYIKTTHYGAASAAPLFTTPEPEKEQAGFVSELVRSATILGLADEAAAWAANPTEENRKAFLAAAESKYESAGGFGMDKGLAKNWQAFKELAGGSLGFLAAPAAAGLVTGGVGANATLGTQYTIENLKRQAEEQEKAISKGEAPAEVSVGRALSGAVGQTYLDVRGMKLLRPLFSKFPGLNKLLGEADEAAVKETGQALEEAIRTGKYEITKGGVFKGIGKGVAIEMPQEIAQQAIERWNAGLSLTDADAQEEYKQAAIGSALLGAPMGGAGAALEQRANKALAEKKVSGEREEAELIKADQEALAAEEAERAKEAAYGLKVAQEKKEAGAQIQTAPTPAPVEQPVKEAVSPAPVEQPVEQPVKEAVAPAPTTPDYAPFNNLPGVTHLFKTARGSTYAQTETGQTVRNRSGEKHKDSTVGVQPASGKTIYLTESGVQTLGGVLQNVDIATQLVPAKVNGENVAQVVLTEDYGPKKKGDVLASAPYTVTPKEGLSPVEIWNSESPLGDDARGIHFGNKITEVVEVEQPVKETVAPTPTSVVTKKGQIEFDFPASEVDKVPVEERLRTFYQTLPAGVTPTIPISKSILDALKIPKQASVRKKVLGKDLNKPEVQEALRSYATNEIVLAENKESSVRVKRALDINRMLQKQEGIPETQMDLFAPTSTQKTVTPAPAPVEEAVTPAPVETTLPQATPDRIAEDKTAESYKYFNKDQIDAIGNNPKSRETLIYLSPEEFLALAKKIPSERKTKEALDELVKSGGRFDSIPFLSFDNEGDGVAKIVGHEGRHRAMALQDIGVKKIPVKFVSREGGKGNAIRWGSDTENKDSFEYIDVWPEFLYSEDGNKIVEFPVKRPTSSKATRIEPEGVGRANDTPSKPTPAQKTVTPAPAPVEEAVTPAPAPVEEDVRERPPAAIPIKPLKDEVEISTPDTAQVNRVGEIMGGDVRATRTDPRHPLYRKGGVEAIAYSAHSTPTGIAVHRVTYNDGSVRTVAFNKAGKEIARELTPAPKQKPLALIPSAVINTAMPLNERIVTTLKSGNLAEALSILGVDRQYPNTLRTISRVLGRVVGSTKVEIVEGLTDSEGNPVAGLFDPKTNTVKLDSVTGLNSHVLMHEQTHAAVSAALDNPSHPVTMKLTKLYNEVRPALRNAYGGKNLQDFVAEAFTNPSFQQELSSILTKGTDLSAFERLINIVSNFIRGLLGLPHKQQAIRSMDDLNTAILSLMAPAPESRNAGELYMAGFDTATKQIDDAIENVPDIQSKQALCI